MRKAIVVVDATLLLLLLPRRCTVKHERGKRGGGVHVFLFRNGATRAALEDGAHGAAVRGQGRMDVGVWRAMGTGGWRFAGRSRCRESIGGEKVGGCGCGGGSVDVAGTFGWWRAKKRSVEATGGRDGWSHSCAALMGRRIGGGWGQRCW